MEDIKKYLLDHLSIYKIPQVWYIVEEIPKNAMGKVNKKELRMLGDAMKKINNE